MPSRLARANSNEEWQLLHKQFKGVTAVVKQKAQNPHLEYYNGMLVTRQEVEVTQNDLQVTCQEKQRRWESRDHHWHGEAAEVRRIHILDHISSPVHGCSSSQSLDSPCKGHTSTCYFAEATVDTARVAYKHITRMLKAHFTDHQLVVAYQSQLKAITMVQASEQVPVRIMNVSYQDHVLVAGTTWGQCETSR